MSIGGNNALMASGLLQEPTTSVRKALAMIAEAIGEFRDAYIGMLAVVRGLGLPVSVCTIYDAIPSLEAAERAALTGFNDAITRVAFTAGIPLIDLRVICTHPDDYSPLSPIEPSVVGGAKIADVICRLLTSHDFATGRTTIWV
jgi:hypothetical protein